MNFKISDKCIIYLILYVYIPEESLQDVCSLKMKVVK